MDAEFTVRIFSLLTDSEQKNVIKDAAKNGFVVNGFKDLTKAPIPVVIKAIEQIRRRAKIQQYHIILESIARLHNFEDDNEQDFYSDTFLEENMSPCLLARLCLKNNILSLEKANHYIKKLEESSLENDNDPNEITAAAKESNHGNYESVQLTKEIKKGERLSKENDTLKKRIEKLQIKIKEYVIANDNLTSSNKRLQKDNEKMKADFETLHHKVETLLITNRALEESKKENECLIEKLKAEKELLEHQKTNKKVYCLTKNELPVDDFNEYSIEVHQNYDINEKIDWNLYDFIWINTRDFAFGVIRDIKRKAGAVNIIKYSYIAELKEKVEEK